VTFLLNIIDKLFIFHRSVAPDEHDIIKRDQVRKARVVVGFSLLLSTIALSLSVIGLLLHDDHQGHMHRALILAAFILFSCPLIIRVKGYEYFQISAFIIQSLMMVMLPLRMSMSGGVFSFVDIYIDVTIMFTALFFGSRGIFITVLYWFAYICVMFSLQSSGYILPAAAVNLSFALFSTVLGLIALGLIVSLFVYVEKLYSEKIAVTEKKIVSGLFSAALSHKINNPLCIAKMTLEKNKSIKKMTDGDLERLQRSLSRISDVLDGLDHLSSDEGTYESQPYAGQSSMIKIPLANDDEKKEKNKND
jgi:signal transduction histidine kinase